MLAQVPTAAPKLADPTEQALIRRCAAVTAELQDEPGDRLLHWDLHYDNILAGDREPWLAIDPEPLAGDPAFDLWPALAEATEDQKTIRRRFDQLTEALSLDRAKAAGWTLARILQNALWDIEDGNHTLTPTDTTIAQTLASPTETTRGSNRNDR
jgi:streptomycin 6-kinase